ncbi:unnamed protein product [Linum tenue]|uniref:Uncharacterized protein n=1 Tax=Linum tenue TaxID=586396 RepID=A0AAV0QWN1_9ROSI|nr:unnamed protein product [Linum tenue]
MHIFRYFSSVLLTERTINMKLEIEEESGKQIPRVGAAMLCMSSFQLDRNGSGGMQALRRSLLPVVVSFFFPDPES